MNADDPAIDTIPSGVPWGPRQVALGVLLFIASLLVAIFLYQVVKGVLDMELSMEYDLVFLGVIVSSLMLVAAWALGPGLHKTSIASLGLELPGERLLYFLALPIPVFLASVGFTIAYSLVISALGWEMLEPPTTPLGDIEPTGTVFILVFLIVALWGPFGEEVLFRGFIFPGLANSLGPIKAALITSGLFALAHQQIGVIIPIFVTGLMLAWLYHRSGSIWPSFIAHGIQNGSALVIFAWGLD